MEEGEFTNEQGAFVSTYFDNYGPIDMGFLFDDKDIPAGNENDEGEGRFFDSLVKHIMLGVKIPKVQIERVIGPILGFFIEDILSSLLDEHIVTISAEFPLRKFENDSGTRNNQSTNIDWLMYCRKKKELIFVELKTTDTWRSQK